MMRSSLLLELLPCEDENLQLPAAFLPACRKSFPGGGDAKAADKAEAGDLLWETSSELLDPATPEAPELLPGLFLNSNPSISFQA